MKTLHDSRNIKHRTPFGGLNCCDQVVLRVEVDRGFSGQVKTRLWFDNHQEIVEMSRVSETLFEAEIRMPEKPGIVWYFFIVQSGGPEFYVGNNGKHTGGVGLVYPSQPPSFQITVSNSFAVPEWVKNRIMYQIFPDSFCNGNPDGSINSPKKGSYLQAHWENKPSYHKDAKGRIIQWGFFGGNLKGIISKLDYLVKLGVGIIYLNPIFEADSPHRYDTGDYLKIDGVLGTLADFDELILEGKKRDIGIILDGVFSHTGASSKYFNKEGTYDSVGAFNSPTSYFYKWYSFQEYPEKYQSWWDVDDLPNVNEMEDSYIDFIYRADNSVIRYWTRRGVMGFRLDVADELPEDFIRGIRKTLEEENPEAFLLGEVWEDASNKVSYGIMRNYFGGDQLHSVMNYPFYNGFIDFINKEISANDLKEIMMSIYENYPKDAVLSAMNLIGSHDRARVLTRLNKGNRGDGAKCLENKREVRANCLESRGEAVKKLKMLTALQMALPGIPSIYYGDEAGLEGGADPYNRGTYPWGREDKDILDWYLHITKIRKESLLELLDQLPGIEGTKDNLLLFHFNKEEKGLTILVNPDENTGKHCELINNFGIHATMTELLTGEKISKNEKNDFSMEIPPQTTFILVTLSQ